MLKIENLSYKHKNSEDAVLKRLNANFGAGRLSAILGPKGSGKTTLLSILSGFETPTQGTVATQGEGIAMIFQDFHLLPMLNAVENVSYPMEQSGIEKSAARRKAKELLESVAVIEDEHKCRPSKLSAGGQQRVAIARALATGARVILADEPTGNLDAANSKVVMAILRNLAHHQGYCIIVATNNPDVIEGADVVYRLSDGMMRQAKFEIL